MPPVVQPGQIKASMGSPWIPAWVYRDFIIALIGIRSASGKPKISVEYIRAANHYIIHGKSISRTLRVQNLLTARNA